MERIRRAEQSSGLSGESDADVLKRSIVEHLRHILNTRQGSAQIASDYGVPDFTNVLGEFGTHSLESIEDTVRGVILTYEPRLSEIQVAHHEERKSTTIGLTFRLKGTIRYRDREIPVVFETVVEPDGQISVSS